MNIYPIASSSSGNAILIGDGTTNILLDAGVSYATLQEKSFFPMNEIDAVLITHEHGDHIKALPTLMARGTECYASEGTWGAILKDLPKWPGQCCYHMLEFVVGSMKIIPFNVKHDCNQPFGYLVKSLITGKKIVYIVDSGVIWFDFKGITHWLVEANHYEKGLQESDLDEKVKKRISENHMSFERLSSFLKSSDLNDTEEIHLLHLSNANSNEQKFVYDLQRQTGVPVYAHGG